jgi:transposase
MKTTAVNPMSEEQAREVVRRELPDAIDRTIRRAYQEGSHAGRQTSAALTVRGSLLDAAITLKAEFETLARAQVPDDEWRVTFGYTTVHHVPGFIFIRLR